MEIKRILEKRDGLRASARQQPAPEMPTAMPVARLQNPTCTGQSVRDSSSKHVGEPSRYRSVFIVNAYTNYELPHNI